ncbi:response regulator transcription factor [Lichenibacterium minor]|uniref:Response regulator transcription factor n=1 Tax=Lichenibacterium minor TaxID=2316528 RepID=A0A4Q2U7G2_9HYPH|nr:response regulator transcription factor [Lichenibacterium minor]RYC32380.1 response regulator transcription factor [Lichenibacterium minor]
MSGASTPLRDTVLVVDDTPDTLGFLTEALERAGITALVATGGAQALALVGRVVPDLILLDAVMPGLDGFECCRQLKAGPAAHVPVIFMTALSDTEHVVAGLGAGGVDYVTKPIRLDELMARIRVHLGNARAAQSARAALDTAGSALVALAPDGAVLWSTPQAAALLRAASPGDGAALPPGLAARLLAGRDAPVLAPGEGGQPSLSFAFVGAVGAGELLFRLSVHDPRGDEAVLKARFPVTAREAEVLLWLARGKSNRDIAAILELAPRTVNKHLETVFAKLGVENRASAAVLAVRALGER